MTLFRVWAPNAEQVELDLDGTPRPMEFRSQGWWMLEVGHVGPGVDYGFRLDGGPTLPDPRSPFQPQGVHERSRLINHSDFPWTDGSWNPAPLSGAVIYELHVGTFTPEGTFEAAIPRLDHLAMLGITHVELMPVAEFPGERGWGYDGVDLFAPHHAYGGPEGLKCLVDACHARGLAVLLDVVYNHLGPVGNYLRQFGPYFTDRYVTPWGDAVNLDGPGSDEVRRFFCDNARMWLRDYHIDGLRLDALHAIVDTSAIHFLEQLAMEITELEAELGRHLVLVAENDRNDTRLLWSRDAGGYNLDGYWNDDFHHALQAVLTGDTDGYYSDFGELATLARALERGLVYDGCYSVYRQRRHGRPYRSQSGHPLIGFLQNHDQVGNRAAGERTRELASTGRLKIGAALVLCSPFTPMLFQGEEWGASTPFQYFTDHPDAEVAEQVRQGRRAEFAAFGWSDHDIPDPQALETFERCRLHWDEIGSGEHAALLDWYRRLIALRRAQPALNDGRLDRVRVRYDESQQWLLLERGNVAIACNFNTFTQTLPVSGIDQARVLLSSETDSGPTGQALTLGPETVAILSLASTGESDRLDPDQNR